MSKSTLPVRPTAAQVRAALGKAPVRGNLSDADIAAYNKGKRANKRYVRGNTRAAKVEGQAVRATLQAQGLAGKRGPLSAAAKQALAQPKG